jgi:hypothetical protein
MGGRVRPISRGRFLALLTIFLLCSSACRTVEPWERKALASARMQSEPHAPTAAFVDHVRQSREAIAAGAGSSGGGCGCY